MKLLMIALLLSAVSLLTALFVVGQARQRKKNRGGARQATSGPTRMSAAIPESVWKRAGFVIALWIIFNVLLWMILPGAMDWWQERGARFFLGTEIAIMILLYIMVAFKDVEEKDKPGIHKMVQAISVLVLLGFAVSLYQWWTKTPQPSAATSIPRPARSAVTESIVISENKPISRWIHLPKGYKRTWDVSGPVKVCTPRMCADDAPGKWIAVEGKPPIQFRMAGEKEVTVTMTYTPL